jgi:hypothetical protein
MKLAESFLELHRTFIIPLSDRADPSFWRHRILISEVLNYLVQDVRGDVGGLASSFLDLAIPLLDCPIREIEASIRLLRPIMTVFSMTASRMTREQLHKRIATFLQTIDRSQPALLRIAVRFVLSLNCRSFGGSFVVKLISGRELRSLDDLIILSELADQASCVSVLSAVVRFGVTKKFWLRASFGVAQELLIQFGGQNDVREWLIILMRRLFITIGLSHIRRKYRRRAVLVCEMLAGLGELPVTWLQQKVVALPSGIVSKPVPPYIRCFFQVSTAVADEVTMHEFDLFAGSSVPLKTFPFDPKRKGLLPPPVTRRLERIKVTRREAPLASSAKPPVKRKIPTSRKKAANSALTQKPKNPGQIASLALAPKKKLPGIWRTGMLLTADV